MSSDEVRHTCRRIKTCPLCSAAPKGAQDMLIDYKPRACALGYEEVSPLWGS